MGAQKGPERASTKISGGNDTPFALTLEHAGVFAVIGKWTE